MTTTDAQHQQLDQAVDQLPVTENGKVQKFRLRERGVTAATWDREAAGYKLAR